MWTELKLLSSLYTRNRVVYKAGKQSAQVRVSKITSICSRVVTDPFEIFRIPWNFLSYSLTARCLVRLGRRRSGVRGSPEESLS